MSVEEAFFDAERDPVSIIFGLHHLLVYKPKWSVIFLQTALALTVFVTAPLASASNIYYQQRCCYTTYPPTSATFSNHGACNDENSLAYVQSEQGECVHGVPTSQVTLIAFAVVASIADICVYLHHSAEYRRDVEDMLKQKHRLKISTRIMMLFPFSGFLLGTYEKITKLSIIYRIRLLFLFSLIGISIAAYTQRIFNIVWGCYETGADVSSGRCDTTTSVIYSTTKGHASVWESTLILWMLLTAVSLAWLLPWYLRFVGWTNRVDILSVEFDEMLRN